MAKYISEYDAVKDEGTAPGEEYALEEIMLEFSKGPPEEPLSALKDSPAGSESEPVSENAPSPDITGGGRRASDISALPNVTLKNNTRSKWRTRKQAGGAVKKYESKAADPGEPESEPKAPVDFNEDSPTIAMSPIRIQEELAAQEDDVGLTPQKAAKRYSKKLPGLRLRLFVTAVICAATGYLTIAGDYGLYLPGLLAESEAARVWIMLVLQVVCGIVALDVLTNGIRGIIRMHIQLSTLALIAYLSSLAHGTLYLTGANAWGMPMGAVACWGLFLILVGDLSLCKGRRAACKAASGTETPNFIVKSEGLWHGPALIKTSGDGREFVRQLESPDGAMKSWSLLSPIFVIASVVLAVLTCVAEGGFEYVFRHLSAISCAALSFGASLAYVAPFRRLSRRLAGRGAALAGWQGIKLVSGRDAIVISDDDLYPAGAVSLNGMKVVGGSSADMALSYTASVVAASGSGLGKNFTELLLNQGVPFNQVNDLSLEDGGMTARIANNSVCVGNRDYLSGKGVHFSDEVKLENAIYTAVNLNLVAIFAVKYGSVKATAEAMDLVLSDSRLRPVLATRNFHLDPQFLSQRLGVDADAMEYPELSDRLGLSDSSPVPGEPAAVLCRQGLLPFAETVVGGRRLKKAVKWNVAISAISSVLGMLILFYLGMAGEAAAGSAANLLIYAILWLVPTLLISGWVNRY